ncbi:hypothetical protein CEXT_674991 [Caerostris extrusa]|uniref:Transposase n=1 Tax=Caerostris extrusa TaxID=172846 RepID=A0AAV4S2S4_CAEEX|nr:hypothetical protein CEXT_674991 [Caerostris extrusa]
MVSNVVRSTNAPWLDILQQMSKTNRLIPTIEWVFGEIKRQTRDSATVKKHRKVAINRYYSALSPNSMEPENPFHCCVCAGWATDSWRFVTKHNSRQSELDFAFTIAVLKKEIARM